MSEQRLGRDVFLALAAIGWADGHLDPDEAAAIVRTATEEGLSADEIAAIVEATDTPLDIGSIDRSEMTKDDRLFVYAVAAWMTRLDGVVTGSETAALARLGDALGLPARPRQHAAAIALEVAARPEGDRPARYDLRALRTILYERLQAAQAARTELYAAPKSSAET